MSLSRVIRLARILGSVVAAAALPGGPLAAQAPPERTVAGLVRAFFLPGSTADWQGIEALPGVGWATLPPTMLENCLADGSCFTRQGQVRAGDRAFVVMATGARTFVTHLYLRNGGAAIGEARLLDALRAEGLGPELSRCPIPGKGSGTSWYRVRGDGLEPGVVAVQTSCGGRPCEGLVLSRGEELPPLQPNQLALYSEQCAAGAERSPVSTRLPHQELASVLVALLAPASEAGPYGWTRLRSLPIAVTWSSEEPRPTNLQHLGDPNPVALTGMASYAERKFSVVAAGSPAQVRAVYFEELGLHPRGEHLLGVVYQQGIAVRLVRCGPVYTASTNNWYHLTSARTRPAMVRQSIRYEGNNGSDSYALRLDGTLPPRDPRDRDPGSGGCQ